MGELEFSLVRIRRACDVGGRRYDPSRRVWELYVLGSRSAEQPVTEVENFLKIRKSSLGGAENSGRGPTGSRLAGASGVA